MSNLDQNIDMNINGRLFCRHQQEEEGQKERVMEGEHDQSTLYSCMRIE
jgi:hypothetical protein